MINRLFTTNSGLPLFFTSMAPLLLCRPCLCDLFCCFRAPGRCVSCLLSAIFAFDVQHVSLHLRSLAKITYKSRSPVIRLLVIGSYLNRTRKPVIQWPNDLQFLWLLVISSSNGCRLGCLCVLQPTHKDLARLCGFSVQIAGRYVWCVQSWNHAASCRAWSPKDADFIPAEESVRSLCRKRGERGGGEEGTLTSLGEQRKAPHQT